MLDLESEVMRGPGFILTGGNILSLDFWFSRSKDENANFRLVCEKPLRKISDSSFFQNEEIFIQLDELDRITHAWIGFNYSITQTQKTF